MAALSLEGVTKRFGQAIAVEGISLDIEGGKLVSFLGPSGCGKTTLLRVIAGLETPTEGRVKLGGEDITDTPAHKRNIGMVFQSLALFPHLSVGRNIAYAVEIRGQDKVSARRRVDELLELVRLPGIATRNISQLSGGERQRVAVARALALKPALFLLDEPMSALDAGLRETLQIELRQLQQKLGVTTVLVTHDQSEAMTMSDLVVVMSEATVQQVGPPLEIYRNPANRFVADFIGMSNLLPAHSADHGALVVAGQPFEVQESGDRPRNGNDLTVLIRPEDVHVLPGNEPGPNQLRGVVDFIRDVGATVEIIVDCDGEKIISMATPRDRPAVDVGARVTVECPAHACKVLYE